MATDGYVLVADHAQVGGGGKIAGEDKFSFKAPGTVAPSVTLAMPGQAVFRAGAWYAPGALQTTVNTILTMAASPANLLYAVPVCFWSAGTITDTAIYLQSSGGANAAIYGAIYRDAGLIPGARIWSGQATEPSLAVALTQFNGLGLTVSKGELLWFVSISKDGTASTINVEPRCMHPVLGTLVDGTGGSNPKRTLGVGYKVSFAYGQPPDPWAGNTIGLNGDDSSVGWPSILYKFTPS